jgi:hypothetical protein
MIPLWLAWPLVCLGGWYIFAFPLGFGWLGYGLSVALAVAVAVWARPRYQVTVLERSERGVVYWVRRVKKGEKEISEKPSSRVLTPRQ